MQNKIKRHLVDERNIVYQLNGELPCHDYLYDCYYHTINSGCLGDYKYLGKYTCLSHAVRGLRRIFADKNLKLLPVTYKPIIDKKLKSPKYTPKKSYILELRKKYSKKQINLIPNDTTHTIGVFSSPKTAVKWIKDEKEGQVWAKEYKDRKRIFWAILESVPNDGESYLTGFYNLNGEKII